METKSTVVSLIVSALVLCLVDVKAQTTFIVTHTDDTGAGSLRQAILDANADSDLDEIHFNITTGSPPYTIQPTSLHPLPVITHPVVIDGYTQPGASPNTNPPHLGSNAVLMIELDGTNAGTTANGLEISAGNSTVRGLVINRFEGHGIKLTTNGGNRIEGNYIGTNVTGDVGHGNGGVGVNVFGSPNNTIGGTVASARNVISGNSSSAGVQIALAASFGNAVQGNFIGTNAAGTDARPNGVGLLIVGSASSNVVGGSNFAGGHCS